MLYCLIKFKFSMHISKTVSNYRSRSKYKSVYEIVNTSCVWNNGETNFIWFVPTIYSIQRQWWTLIYTYIHLYIYIIMFEPLICV